jgi:hypothetical protein
MSGPENKEVQTMFASDVVVTNYQIMSDWPQFVRKEQPIISIEEILIRLYPCILK